MRRRPAAILCTAPVTVGVSIRGVNQDMALLVQRPQELLHTFKGGTHEPSGFGLVVGPGGDLDIEPEG